MGIVINGLLFVNVALWLSEAKEVRYAGGFQPHPVSYEDLENIEGVTCKGTKITVDDKEYTINELAEAVKSDPTSFSTNLVDAFAET